LKTERVGKYWVGGVKIHVGGPSDRPFEYDDTVAHDTAPSCSGTELPLEKNILFSLTVPTRSSI
jgi:hypothetical protein